MKLLLALHEVTGIVRNILSLEQATSTASNIRVIRPEFMYVYCIMSRYGVIITIIVDLMTIIYYLSQ